MPATLSRRIGAPASGLAALLVAGGLWASPAAAAPPTSVAPRISAITVPAQEAGVTLRVYDLQKNLTKLCTLKSAQTPNIDKKMSVIDFKTTDDFGYDNQFASETLANVNITTAGEYTFRLLADDGARLTVDGTTLITHDGQHAAEPGKDGTVTLDAGYHSLKIDHFEAGGGQQVTLQWKTPGSSTFVLVPASVLSTEAGVVRVTSVGKKECEGATDSAGDGLTLDGVHPNYTLGTIRESGWEPQVTGLDFFSDGRLVVSTWGGGANQQNNTPVENGEVWVLSGVKDATSPSGVTRQKIASGLREPMGVKVVDGKVYVSEKDQLTRLDDTNGDGVTDTYTSIATWPFGGNFHEFGFGLIYKDGFFYLNLSVSINYGGATTNPQPANNRGTTIKVNKDTGAVTYVAGGLRTPHGIGFGPEGEIFVTDNQGDWLPSSKMVHVKQGRFFSHKTNPAGPFDSTPATPPALWLPHEYISLSPSQPFLLTTGPFAGQMVIGDVTYGGLQRAHLEKVGGEYQGAVFRMTQGLESGITRVIEGPDGVLYVGGLGAGGNWGQNGKLTYGLQKLTPNGTTAFDFLAMRAVSGGFELEYTKPISTTTAATLASKYIVEQWENIPAAGYGAGNKQNEETLTVTSASLSTDNKKVTLLIDGLEAGKVVHVRSPRPFTSSSGDSLWNTEAWYTLNALGTATPGTGGGTGGGDSGGGGSTTGETVYQAESATRAGGAGVNTDHTGYTGTGFVDGYGSTGASTTFDVTAASAGSHDVTLRYSNGPYPAAQAKTISLYVNGTKQKQISLASTANWDTWADHKETVTLNSGANTIAYKVDSGDYGHVNLDKITVKGTAATTASTTLQAENATRAGGAGVNTDHTGYRGTGFVDGYGSTGASTTFSVTATSAGSHDVTLRYSNGPYPAAQAKTISLYVNGSKVKQISLASTANWDTWADHKETVTLTSGSNTIAYKVDSDDYGHVNLDEITVVGTGASGGDGGSSTNRVQLFDGTNLDLWENTSGGAPSWTISDGSAEVTGGDIRTKAKYQDFKLHVEFLIPQFDSSVTGQQRGNSGVYLQERYEIQVLDSYGDTTLSHDEAGGIYSKRAPDSNQATAPGTWQTYEITFRAARFNSSGTKTENARVTVVWNGVTVHNDVEINGGTGGGIDEGPEAGSIRLQDHFDPGPNVRYRNIWIEPAT